MVQTPIMVFLFMSIPLFVWFQIFDGLWYIIIHLWNLTSIFTLYVPDYLRMQVFLPVGLKGILVDLQVSKVIPHCAFLRLQVCLLKCFNLKAHVPVVS